MKKFLTRLLTLKFLRVNIMNVRNALSFKSRLRKVKNKKIILDKKDLSNKIINAVINGSQSEGFQSLSGEVKTSLRLPRLGL